MMLSHYRGNYLVLLMTLISLLFTDNSQANSIVTPNTPQKTNAPVMRICYEDRGYFPYATTEPITDSKTLNVHGVFVDLIIKTAARLNLSIQLVRLPWKRCIQHLSQGKTDAIFAAIWTPERESIGVFPTREGQIDVERRLWSGSYQVFTHKQSSLKWNDGQFSGLKLGVAAPLGYITYDKLAKLDALPLNNLTSKEGFTLLAKRKLDGYVVERYIGLSMIKDMKLTAELSALTTTFMQVNLYLPVSHQWNQQYSALTLQFWQTLSEIRQEQGDMILAGYLNQ
ncbi:transporter substrate-binding domain-containing protein [Shewanella sp. VB17]|uniref:substrate-binding periplasmic protein n=1 Tax=Shewanella sp. VB17 TaxID=2739432 RepID=UPI001563E69E|nr:transporter substrate-binding domain-containing protein [Shewanella sp. VB17]NRD75606.1 transporter substrate-binding domain-containing protein [Shewanella sp. VB17]